MRALIAVWVLFSSSMNGQSQRDAKKVADVVAGDAKKSVAENPQCRLFTWDEVAKFVGEPAAARANAAGGTACHWVTKDGAGDMIVQVVPAANHSVPRLGKGYKALPAVGTKAYVIPLLDGWLAGVLKDDESIVVSVSGIGASESTAIELLNETLKRRSKPH